MELITEDLSFCLQCLPDNVLGVLQMGRVFLGGGFVRACVAHEKPSDIDLFCGDAIEVDRLAPVLAGDLPIIQTANAATILADVPVQFIRKFTFTNAAELITSFDFTVARAAIWFADGQFRSIVDDRFYADLAGRRLHYTGTGVPGGSLLRLVKFLRRGYTISPESLALLISKFVDGIAEKERGYEAFLKALRELDPRISRALLAQFRAGKE